MAQPRGRRPLTFPYDRRRSPPAPVLPVRVGVPGAEPAAALLALVDSGADLTVLPQGVPAALGLPAVGQLTVRGVAGSAQATVYAAALEVAGRQRVAEVVALGGEALLGRNVLNAWALTLDGPAETLRLRR